MDYKEKYEKALAHARQAYGTGAYDDATLEAVFPELINDEEWFVESLRNFIHDFARSIGGKVTAKDNISRDSVRNTLHKYKSWLEKQKEQSMPSSTEMLAQWEQERKVLEEKDFRGDEWRLAYNAFMDGYARGIAVKQKEQKQEWGEEDEDMLNSCISSIEEAKENRYAYKETDGDTSYDREINWLKSLLPDTYKNCNSRWKTSEDEDRLINTSISFLKDFADKGYENAVECIDWLKSKLNGDTCK